MDRNIAAFLVFLSATTVVAQSNSGKLFVGTYTNACESEGIYVYDFNFDTAAFQLVGSSKDVANPSFISIADNDEFIYSVNENGGESSVSAFSFDRISNGIALLNREDSKGANPCHIINDAANVIVANYSGGTIAVFGRQPDGKLSPAKQVISHHGNGPNNDRQESAHVHMVAFSPDKKFLLANDLGTDEVSIYRYHPNEPENILVLKEKVKVKPGSGPRHLTFSPDGKFVYLLHELDGALTTFSYGDGKLIKIVETSVVQPGFKVKTGAADIHISNDGKFVYASNRGDANTISVFSTGKNGSLTHVETISSGGKGPRNFAISPGGKYVLVAHQQSNEIVIFKRDADSGKLTATGNKIALCAPVCLIFRKS